MTAIKSKQESRVILDFTNQKYTKKYIKKSLTTAEVLEILEPENLENIVFIENNILIGMYRIHLLFSSLDATASRHKLKDYGKFKIAIFERCSRNREKQILLKKDKRFKSQNWVDKNFNYKLGIRDLTDIICLCQKMDHLKAFL